MKPWTSIMAGLVALPIAMASETDSDSSFLQSIAMLPDCAKLCVLEKANETTCFTGDVNCICTDIKFMEALSGCAAEKCSFQDSLILKNVSESNCWQQGRLRDKSDVYVAISTSFTVVSSLFMGQRILFNLWAKKFGLDDLFILITSLFTIPIAALNQFGLAANGMGKDIWSQDTRKTGNFGRFFYVFEVLYFAALACLKLCFLFFYLRIFPDRQVRQLLWGTVVFVCLYGLAFTLVAIFQCHPISFFWWRWDHYHSGKCLNINAISWANAAISIALDIWILAIPLWQLRKLNLDWKKKAGVGLMFSVGTIITIVSVLRLHSLVQFTADSDNQTWEYFNVGIWSTIELNVGVICACLPTLRLLLARCFPNLLTSTRHRYIGYGESAKKSAGGRYDPQARSHLESKSHGQDTEIKPIQITYTKTFGVDYSDHDDTELINMANMEAKQVQSSSQSDRSFG